MVSAVLEINGFHLTYKVEHRKCQIGSFISEEKNITFGVSLGSALSPLLFHI